MVDRGKLTEQSFGARCTRTCLKYDIPSTDKALTKSLGHLGSHLGGVLACVFISQHEQLN